MAQSLFTPKAHWIGAASLVALLLSLWGRSWVLLMMAFAGLAMLASSRLALARSLGSVFREIESEAVSEGQPLPVTVGVAGPRRGSALVELRDRLDPVSRLGQGANYRILFLRRKAQKRFQYEAVVPRLGVFRAGPLEVRREDPFGVRMRVDLVAPATEYLVRPRAEDLRKSPERSEMVDVLLGRHEVSRPGEGFDFFGLRDYVPGDRMRAVNWKASARSQHLVVNEFERESDAEIVLFLDARAVTESGLESETPYAQGARVVASLVKRYLRARDRVRVVAYGESVREIGGPGRTRRLEDLTDALARLRPAGDDPLLAAVDQEMPRIRRQSPAVIVSPLIGDPTTEAAVTKLRGHVAHVTLIVPLLVPGDRLSAAWTYGLLEQHMAAESLRMLGALVVELRGGEPISVQVGKVR